MIEELTAVILSNSRYFWLDPADARDIAEDIVNHLASKGS